MSLLHDAYTALFAGLTYRTGNEIHWYNKDGCPITVEPVDVEQDSYIVRYFYENGDLYIEIHYLQDQRHGKRRGWHHNGQLQWEMDYVNGQRHGKYVWWYKSGREYVRENYVYGKLHGSSIWWFEDGTLICEEYYINGRQVTPEEWDRHNDSTT